jgi:transposase
VASDVLGQSGRAMLRAIVSGEGDPVVLAELARGRLRAKLPQLQEALLGEVTAHHRFLLRILLDQVEFLEGQIDRLGARIAEVLPAPFAEAIERLVTIPGIDRRAAENIVAELGADMSPFRSAGHLASWVGICPGNHESAGKRRSGRTTKGNAWLRVTLVQCAWAASHTKGTYLAAQYKRLAARRGKKRSLVAVGHTLLGVVYAVLKKKAAYRELGADYLDRQDKQKLAARLLKRLEKLGVKVTVEAVT